MERFVVIRCLDCRTGSAVHGFTRWGKTMRKLLIVFIILALAATAKTAKTQVPYRSYMPPAGSPLPSQLEYFRPQSGVLDPYNQFIVPREQLANRLGAITQQQASDYNAIERQLPKSDQIRKSQSAATGSSASFINYSHCYSGRGAGASRPARQVARPPVSMPNMNFGFGT